MTRSARDENLPGDVQHNSLATRREAERDTQHTHAARGREGTRQQNGHGVTHPLGERMSSTPRSEAKALSAAKLREYQQYSAAHIQETLQTMMAALFTETPLPADPVAFMHDFLAAKQRSQGFDGGEAREELMRRLNRAAAQLDAAGLAQLVESAERQGGAAQPEEKAPGGGSPRAAEEVLVTFTEPGSLGMKLNDHEGTGQPRVVAINAGTQAEHHPQLKPGLLITRVGTTSIAGGMAYKSVLGLLKAAGRPCTLAFVPADAGAAEPDMGSLQAAAEAATQQAAASRSARQARQRRKGMSVAEGDGTLTQAEMAKALAEVN